MGEIDKRNKLDEEPFTYLVGKEQKIRIYYFAKHIMSLSGKDSEKFLKKIDGLEGKEAQLVLAKVTGNFKHGNERQK